MVTRVHKWHGGLGEWGSGSGEKERVKGQRESLGWRKGVGWPARGAKSEVSKGEGTAPS